MLRTRCEYTTTIAVHAALSGALQFYVLFTFAIHKKEKGFARQKIQCSVRAVLIYLHLVNAGISSLSALPLQTYVLRRYCQ